MFPTQYEKDEKQILFGLAIQCLKLNTVNKLRHQLTANFFHFYLRNIFQKTEKRIKIQME